jgi:hypothetical protein
MRIPLLWAQLELLLGAASALLSIVMTRANRVLDPARVVVAAADSDGGQFGLFCALAVAANPLFQRAAFASQSRTSGLQVRAQ